MTESAHFATTTTTSKTIDNSISNELDAIRAVLEEEAVDDPAPLESKPQNGIKEDTNSIKTSPSDFVRPSYIPPHLMGRDLNNPANDVIGTGRRVQKPRLGVKVPYRNLTSQIVTQDEIAQEIFERSLRKYSYTDAPKGGDTFFAMKLTHRLANKIGNEKADTTKVKKIIDSKIITLDKKILSMNKSGNTENSQNEINKLSKLIEKKDCISEKVEEIFAEISNSITEDKKKSVDEANVSTSSAEEKYIDSQSLDNEALLAILEGGNETTEISESNISVSESPSSVVSSTPKPAKPNQGSRKRITVNIDPELEKKLALEQLQNFPSKRGPRGIHSVSASVTTRDAEKKVTSKRPCYNLSSVPKRFPKKYQRSIKRQMRISKQKSSTDPTPLKLPDVPEVQIAIDKYIRTYANKRKQKPNINDNKHEPIVPAVPVAILDELEADTELEPTAGPSKDPIYSETEKLEDRESGEEAEDEAEEETEEHCAVPEASSKVMREINRLLGDEGAINMIYSVETRRLSSAKKYEQLTPKRKNLLSKKNLVKNAVLGLSVSSSQSAPEKSRPKRSPIQRKADEKSATSSPNLSSESVAIKSPTKNTPKVVRKIAAEASRIIRRHSSSSAYSSDENENEMSEFNNLDQNIETPSISASMGLTPDQQLMDIDTLEKPKIESITQEIRQPDQGNNNAVDIIVESKEKSTLKDLTVMKYENIAQIILSTSSVKMKNALNADVLREFTGILQELEHDDECKIILVTSKNDSFCEGIELESLICDDGIERTITATKYVNAITEFARCLCQFSKLLIAGVNGPVVGLGVTMLPFFDLVYASNKASFSTPYVKLGQIPEAGGLTTLTHFVGSSITNELLFGCRTLTANEALKYGLITKILDVENFDEELLPMVESLANHSAQSMKAMKLLLRQDMNVELEDQLKKEADLLLEQWCSDECQNQFRNYLK